MNLLIEKALEIALKVHREQVDKVGRPYILHVLRVAAKAKNDIELITALLHDAVEDSGGRLTFTEIYNTFPTDIAEAVVLLTRLPGEKYMDHIKDVASDPLATRVKLYDLEDNLDFRRQDFVGAESLAKRYIVAEEYLLNVVDKDRERYDY